MKTKPTVAHIPVTGDEGGADWWAQVWVEVLDGTTLLLSCRWFYLRSSQPQSPLTQ